MKKLIAPAVLALSVAGLIGTQAPAHATAAAPAATVTLQGRVLNSSTLAPVAGVVVTARDVVDRSHVYARTTSGSMGYFTLNVPADMDEFAVAMNGVSVSYEYGWVSCAHTVVATWGAACSHGAGILGNVRIDHA